MSVATHRWGTVAVIAARAITDVCAFERGEAAAYPGPARENRGAGQPTAA